jgi:hypothetical protein
MNIKLCVRLKFLVTCNELRRVRRLILYSIYFLFPLGNLYAQHVIYSSSSCVKSLLRFQVIGKSEDYYWVEKLQKQKTSARRINPDDPGILNFDLFNSKLELLNETRATSLPGAQKQWLLAGKKGLDQLIVSHSSGQTKITCSRFFPNEIIECRTRVIDSLPFSTSASSFLLVRSEDHSKNLLIIFENTDSEYTCLHALLFDSDWNPIYKKVISHKQFSMPCIQDEEIGFPGESFDNLPIKLANNGEWLMASPSLISRNFSLFHICPDGNKYYFREIPVSVFYKMEDISMAIDNNLQEMSVGLLSSYGKTTFKNVQVFKYSMQKGEFYFDSSYHFNAQAGDIQNHNLTHESFISVQGGGYMYLKEYGSPYTFDKATIPFLTNWETAYLMADYSESGNDKNETKQSYLLNRGLSPVRNVHNKGDLNLFYFPAISRDSAWTGFLNMEQHTESNNPDLSYLLIPEKNKLYIIYNSVEGTDEPVATTTTLNRQGQSTGDALVFWKIEKMLNFQQSHRFSPDEVSVPYLNNLQGFAIIRFQ